MRRIRPWAVLGCALMSLAAPVAARPAKETPTPKQQAQAFFEDGVRKQQAGDYTGAIRAYNISLQYDAKQAEALAHRGFCYTQLQRYPQALADYEAVLKLKPKDKAAQAAAAALKAKIDAATPPTTPPAPAE